MENKKIATALTVDDNRIDLTLLCHILKKQNYHTLAASNGTEALTILQQNEPDIILLDVMMPGEDGFQVCSTIKQNHKLKNIPVIFLTSQSETRHISKGFEVGGVDYVTKPFNTAELVARVETQIKLKRAYEEINTLKGIIPICSYCKSIRNDDGYWEQVEKYIEEHSSVIFSHGLCAECAQRMYPGFFEEKEKKSEKNDIRYSLS
ncbi:response regulator [candidate division KSB1 bacterium]|nr:response regulator [candidate division KSB1 bacterium]